MFYVFSLFLHFWQHRVEHFSFLEDTKANFQPALQNGNGDKMEEEKDENEEDEEGQDPTPLHVKLQFIGKDSMVFDEVLMLNTKREGRRVYKILRTLMGVRMINVINVMNRSTSLKAAADPTLIFPSDIPEIES